MFLKTLLKKNIVCKYFQINMKEEDLAMARTIVAESQEQSSSPGTSPAPLRRTRVQDLIEKRNQFR